MVPLSQALEVPETREALHEELLGDVGYPQAVIHIGLGADLRGGDPRLAAPTGRRGARGRAGTDPLAGARASEILGCGRDEPDLGVHHGDAVAAWR